MDLFLSEFVQQHRLPTSFSKTAEDFYIPLSEKIYAELGEKPYVLGINGAQGTGKSTLADFIGQYLSSCHNLNVVSLSIDDIYLTQAERQQLQKEVHPLLITRGVPGTHDVELGCNLIHSLKQLRKDETLAIPRFDKSIDDRMKPDCWDSCSGPVDLIILEGWCVGSTPEDRENLEAPINQLESNEDSECIWREYANRQLEEHYPKLFDMIDSLILLKAPSFESVHGWRLEQEQKLAANLGGKGSHLMDEAQVARFITHYERITRHNLKSLPEVSFAVLELGDDHQVKSLRYQST